ncbi:hypothetical protein AOL_s00097g284 [Orbilia oligospora ATCC 24927]|uniref:DOMON domain-containing protein n=1 Tax=Arthrobotrys oligospora (strain ATCC 24927 / CBS 115.81 / DSM 1491) TaxID=756982 RepID=G1XIV7_ARTOA|nr:hypothetical protein AOL_s00097g284 [Orbilia oligospora ATCC 24927]EGX46858.1 hypothetical protein AOL_s00097g284 [Orbilia oligospora ATCC 24927]
MRWKLATSFASLIGLSTAQLARYVSPSDSSVSFSLNIPTSTSTSGSGAIFFQIRGPATGKTWIALGIGSGMAGAHIFIVYTDGSGNVTVSARAGQGHFEPVFSSDAQITVLDGSGIVGGSLIANVRCDNCLSLAELSVTNTRSNWIWADKDGSALDSSDVEANIQQHDRTGVFTFDLTRAAGGDSSNPFVQSAQSSASTTATGFVTRTTGGPRPTSTNGASGDDGDDNLNLGSGSSNIVSSAAARIARMLKIHGILMGLAFAVFFPLGAIIIRLMPGPHKADIHMIVQVVGFALSVAGLAYGVLLAEDLRYLKETHPIIGMVVMGGLFFQPIVGLIHHWLFKAKGKRTILAYIHTYWGRAILILGIVNGGLGLQLADNTTGGTIAYSVVAGVMGLAWLAASVLYYVRGGSNIPIGGDAKLEKPLSAEGLRE